MATNEEINRIARMIKEDIDGGVQNNETLDGVNNFTSWEEVADYWVEGGWPKPEIYNPYGTPAGIRGKTKSGRQWSIIKNEHTGKISCGFYEKDGMRAPYRPKTPVTDLVSAFEAIWSFMSESA